MKTTFSFPGLGIGEHTISKVAFTIPIFGGLEIRWYAIFLTLGIVAGFFYAMWRAKKEDIKSDDIIDFALVVVPLAVICARLYFVLTTVGKPGYSYKSFYDVIAIWEGGIAIYGAVMGGALGLFLVSRFKKYTKDKVVRLFDLVAPGVMLGQIIGRWGNFVNGEAHGYAVSEDFFLAMGLMERNRMVYYHPTFLYESLWNLLGFVIINILYRRKKFNGQIVLLYLSWYGLGRMFIEGIRTDSLMVGPFRISQVVAFLCFVICTSLLVWLWVRAARQGKDEGSYVPVYEKLRGFTFKRKKEISAEDEAAANQSIDRIIARAEQARSSDTDTKNEE